MFISKCVRSFSGRNKSEESKVREGIYQADGNEEVVRSQITRDNNEVNRSLLDVSRNDVSIRQVDGGLNDINEVDASGHNLNAELLDLIGASDENLLQRVRNNRDLIQEIRHQIEDLVTKNMRGSKILNKILDNFDELVRRMERLENVVPIQSSLGGTIIKLGLPVLLIIGVGGLMYRSVTISSEGLSQAIQASVERAEALRREDLNIYTENMLRMRLEMERNMRNTLALGCAGLGSLNMLIGKFLRR